MPRRVTLSFDNGPDPEVTPFVHERLAAHGIFTTFFCLGSKLSTPEGAAMAKRSMALGHQIGNHTFSHKKPLGLLPPEEAASEFDRTTQALAAVGETKRLFRPYGGGGKLGPHLMQPSVVERLIRDRYTCVLWNCVSGDWKDPEGWLARATAIVDAQEWSLVVLHDINMASMQHLETFLQHLERENFEFRQDFPASCLPIVDGEIRMPIEQFSSEPALL